MELSWPPMVTAGPGVTYRTRGERLYWPDYHVSLLVPGGARADAGEIGCFIQSNDGALQAILDFYNPSHTRVRNWLDEAFHDNGQELTAAEAIVSKLGVSSRRFASSSRAGYKLEIGDPFGNGISGRFSAAGDRAKPLSRLLKQIIRSVRFVHTEPLTEPQIRTAMLPFLNVDATDGAELLVYVNRHFYLLRNDVMKVIDALATQLQHEGNPMAERVVPRWQVLQEARRRADSGARHARLTDLRALRSRIL